MVVFNHTLYLALTALLLGSAFAHPSAPPPPSLYLEHANTLETDLVHLQLRLKRLHGAKHEHYGFLSESAGTHESDRPMYARTARWHQLNVEKHDLQITHGYFQRSGRTPLEIQVISNQIARIKQKLRDLERQGIHTDGS